jgi:predicted metal-dependent phosphotriesterase family hydrolase
MASPDCRTVGDVDFTVVELEYFKQVGGTGICEASPIGLRGDVRDLRVASERADVHVVFAAGLYVADVRPEGFEEMAEEALVDFFAREVAEGAEGTGIRPGFLKCALSAVDPSAELFGSEVTTLRALRRLSAATGLSLQVHTAFPMSHDQVLEGVDAALGTGMAPDRLVMIHMDSFLRPWDALTSYVADLNAVMNGTGARVGRDRKGMRMGSRLEGKVAVVTGSGMGAAKGIAVGLAREGAKVVTNNRKPGSVGLSAWTDKEATESLLTDEDKRLGAASRATPSALDRSRGTM